jgi:hypothetical protein
MEHLRSLLLVGRDKPRAGSPAAVCISWNKKKKKKKIHRFGTITLHYIKSTQLGVAARVANRKATVDIIELREIMSRMAAPHKNSFM